MNILSILGFLLLFCSIINQQFIHKISDKLAIAILVVAFLLLIAGIVYSKLKG